MQLDAPAQPVVDHLAEERADLALRLRADAHVRQAGRDVLGLHDAAGGVDLVGDLEAVAVVVHRVEERQPPVPPPEPRDLAALEDPALPGARTIAARASRAAPSATDAATSPRTTRQRAARMA